MQSRQLEQLKKLHQDQADKLRQEMTSVISLYIYFFIHLITVQRFAPVAQYGIRNRQRCAALHCYHIIL